MSDLGAIVVILIVAWAGKHILGVCSDSIHVLTIDVTVKNWNGEYPMPRMFG